MKNQSIVDYFNILISNPNSKAFSLTDTKVLFDQAQDGIEVMIRNAEQDHLLVTTGTLNLVANQEAYNLPSDYVYMKRVEVNTTPYRAVDPIDYERRRDYSGDKDKYYIINTQHTTGSTSTYAMIGIRGTPTANSTAAIRYDYVRTLPDFVDTWNANNIPAIPHPGPLLIAEKAAKIYLTMSNMSTRQVDDLIQQHETEFLDTIKARQRQEPPRIRVIY
jgi:hypothetical protein